MGPPWNLVPTVLRPLSCDPFEISLECTASSGSADRRYLEWQSDCSAGARQGPGQHPSFRNQAVRPGPAEHVPGCFDEWEAVLLHQRGHGESLLSSLGGQVELLATASLHEHSWQARSAVKCCSSGTRGGATHGAVRQVRKRCRAKPEMKTAPRVERRTVPFSSDAFVRTCIELSPPEPCSEPNWQHRRSALC